MMLRLIASGIALLFMASLSAQLAQPLSTKYELEKVESEHVEVYAQADNIAATNRIARLAEQARYELGILFDYRPVGKYKLLYFPSSQALMNSNVSWTEPGRRPGRVLFPQGMGLIIHPGTSSGLYQEVRKAMARIILEEFASGTRFNTVLQKELLLYDAQWFNEGLIEYAGSGWTYEDERQLAGAIGENLIDLAMEGDDELNRILRKSIWHFIVHEYGQQKISEIVYLVNISHSIESGIISVLGITINTLTLRWERYLQSRVQNMLTNRFKLSEYGPSSEINLPKGHQLLGIDFDPDSSRVAAMLSKEGQMRVQIYDVREKSWISTPIKSGFRHGDANRLKFHSTVSWHPKGHSLYAPIWRKNKYVLAVYDLIEKELTFRELPRDVRHIYEMDFSHNGKRLVFSALHKGRIDIYEGPGKEGRFKALTNDAYDNLEPAWSEDDQSIFYVSNRDQIGETTFEQQLYAYENSFDIYQLIMAGDTALKSRITRTPFINERHPQVEGTSEIWYLSDRSGISNLESMDVFRQKNKPLTNLTVGIGAQKLRKRSLLLTQADGKGVSVFVVNKGELGENEYPEPSIQRLEDDSKRRIKEQKEKLKKDRLEKALNEEPAEKKKEFEEDKPKKKQSPRYYIFDDDDEPYEVNKAEKGKIAQSPGRVENPVPNTVFGRIPKPKLENIDVSRPVSDANPWKSELIGLNFHYDPISTLGFKFDMAFKDLSGNHQLNVGWIPFIRLRVAPRDHIVKAEYAYKKNKIDLIGETGLTTRFLWIQDVSTSLDSLIFRYNQLYANVGARLPLSAQSLVEAKVGIIHMNRLDQRLTRLVLLNDRDNLLRGGVKALFEDVEEQDGFQVKGLRAEAQADYFHSLNSADRSFLRARVKVNYYRPVYKKMVLALQLSGGFSSNQFVPQYYLGGVPGQLHNPLVFQRREENRIRDNSVDTALYALQFAEFINPMRGFGYNTRSGSRYVIANVELRIPVSRLLRYSLQPSSLYNIELIPFLDAGTVWTEGNPFSQRKPTDTQFITSGNVTIKLQTLKSPFLIGMGTGVRINLLSWSARFDLAWGLDDFILQRPQLTTSLSKNF